MDKVDDSKRKEEIDPTDEQSYVVQAAWSGAYLGFVLGWVLCGALLLANALFGFPEQIMTPFLRYGWVLQLGAGIVVALVFVSLGQKYNAESR